MTKLKNMDKFYVPTWLVFAGLVHIGFATGQMLAALWGEPETTL